MQDTESCPMAGPSSASSFSFTLDSHRRALPLSGALVHPPAQPLFQPSEQGSSASPVFQQANEWIHAEFVPRRSILPRRVFSQDVYDDRDDASYGDSEDSLSRGNDDDGSSEAGDEWEEIPRYATDAFPFPIMPSPGKDNRARCSTRQLLHHSHRRPTPPSLTRLITSPLLTQSTRPPTPELCNQPSSHFSDSDSDDDSSEADSDDPSDTESDPTPYSVSEASTVAVDTQELWEQFHSRHESPIRKDSGASAVSSRPATSAKRKPRVTSWIDDDGGMHAVQMV